MTLIVLIVLLSFFSYGKPITSKPFEEGGSAKRAYTIADFDEDGIVDSLYYDFEGDSIVFLFSSRDFVPFSEVFYHEGGYVEIIARDGGFVIHTRDMRWRQNEGYTYDSQSGRFRQTYFSFDGRSVDSLINYSLDLLSGSYTANYELYNIETDSFTVYSDIQMHITNDPVYWGDSFHMPEVPFIEEYAKNYIPPSTDTVIFMGFNEDYDYPQLIGINDDGNSPGTLMSNFEEEIHKGDVLLLFYATLCYQEAGDPDLFLTYYGIANIEKINEGNLSKFYKTNRKEIRYNGVHKDSWRYEYRCPADVDYFLANTADKQIQKQLHKPGRLEVTITEFDGNLMDRQPGVGMLVEIVNIHNGKQNFVCKLILDISNDLTIYYLWNEKIGEYTEWLPDDYLKSHTLPE